MLEPRRLTSIWASMASYTDNFTFTYVFYIMFQFPRAARENYTPLIQEMRGRWWQCYSTNINRNSFFFFFFFLKFLEVGVGLSPLSTSATTWTIVPAPDDRWCWMWSSRWNENWQGKPKYSENPAPRVTLFTTNPTWPDLGSDPGHRCGNSATNRLSYGTENRNTQSTVGDECSNKISLAWIQYKNFLQKV
jgi:hypothetical protein